jgi:hypothetical protein
VSQKRFGSIVAPINGIGCLLINPSKYGRVTLEISLLQIKGNKLHPWKWLVRTSTTEIERRGKIRKMLENSLFVKKEKKVYYYYYS